MSWSVLLKDNFTIIIAKVTMRAHIIKIWLFLQYFWAADPFATKLSLVVYYHKPEYHGWYIIINPSILWKKYCIAVFKVKVTVMVQNFGKNV